MRRLKLIVLCLALLCSIGTLTFLSRPSFSTVNEVVGRADYVGNGSTVAFTYPFRILTKNDIEVLVNGVTKLVDSDFVVSGLGASGGGTVTFTVAPANGLKVALLRKQPAQQTSVYQANTALNATRLEQDLDKLQMQIQQIKEQLQRIPAFEKKSLLKDKVFPDFGADKFLHVTADGLTLEWVSPVTVGTLNIPAFTTGSVPFATGSATLGQDNANLFWDDANNRLGIGTATPSTQLHAVGNATLGGTLGVTGATTLSSTLAVTGASTLPTISGPTTYTGTHTIPTIAGPTSTTGTWTFGGTSTSTKACAAGYTRVGPNMCHVNNQNALAFTDAVACTARTLDPVLPADAKLALLEVTIDALSNNAVAGRRNTVSFHNSATCAAGNLVSRLRVDFLEQTAIAAGTILDKKTWHTVVPLLATNTYYTTQDNAGGNGNADVEAIAVLAYWD